MVEKAVGRSWESDMNILIWSTCRGRSKNDTVFFFNTHSVKAPCLVFLSKLWHFQKRKKEKKKMQTSSFSLWANRICECTKNFFSWYILQNLYKYIHTKCLCEIYHFLHSHTVQHWPTLLHFQITLPIILLCILLWNQEHQMNNND